MDKQNENALEQILEEAEIFKSLSNDLKDSFIKVLKWKKLSQAELSRRACIAERTISQILNGERIGSVESIVMMCLAAGIPGYISEHIINLSGNALIMTNEDHVVYRYLLWHKYNESFPEIHVFLHDIGSHLCMRFPQEP